MNLTIGTSLATWRAAGSAVVDPSTTSPLWLITPASGQTGNAAAGVETWQLGATSGTETSDPTFNAGPPAYWSLDGGDYVEVLHPTPTLEPTFGTSDQWTLMVVARFATPPGTSATLLSMKSGGVASSSPGPRIALLNSTVMQTLLGDGTSGVATGTAGMTTTANVWLVVFAHTVSTTGFATRVNGVTSATATRPAGSQSPTLTGTRLARLGANYFSVSNQLTGDIRAAAAWQRQLSASEMAGIELHYGAGT